jgi:hypothetical protein
MPEGVANSSDSVGAAISDNVGSRIQGASLLVSAASALLTANGAAPGFPLLALQLGNTQALAAISQPVADQLFQGLVHTPGNATDAGHRLERFVAGNMVASPVDAIDRLDWDSLSDGLSWESPASLDNLTDGQRRWTQPEAIAPAVAQDTAIPAGDLDYYFATAADPSDQAADSD